MKIQKLVIDSTFCKSDLCELGAIVNTDKSPYNSLGHRHPYTGVYSLLLSRYRQHPVRFAEIGIASSSSVIMWRHFFIHINTEIFAFDSEPKCIDHCLSFRMPNVFAGKMDVSQDSSISDALAAIGGNLDVLLDDSSHNFGHQIQIIKNAVPFIKSGGMIIIEDVFRTINEKMFEDALGPEVLDAFAFGTLILTEHKDKFSADWNNDQLLVLVKK